MWDASGEHISLFCILTAVLALVPCNKGLAAEKERESVRCVFDSTGDWMQDGEGSRTRAVIRHTPVR